MISFLKVADSKMSLQNLRKEVKDDTFEDLDALFEAENRDILKQFIHSADWTVARTIYSTLQVQGRVVIEQGNGKSKLVAEITSIDVARMDSYIGDMTSDQAPKPAFSNSEEEDFDEDDDEEETLDSKTSEGGLIRALINMQIKPRLQGFLPKFSQVFSDQKLEVVALDCYGIELKTPYLNYF